MSKDDPETEEPGEAEPIEGDTEEEKSPAIPETVKGEGEIVSEDDLPFPAEFLEGAPPSVIQFLRSTFSMRSMSGPVFNPLSAAIAKVLDAEHLTLFMQSMDRNTELEARSAYRARWVHLAYVSVVLVFAGVVVYMLKDSNPDLLTDLITRVIGIAGGLGTGFGVGVYIIQRKQ